MSVNVGQHGVELHLDEPSSAEMCDAMNRLRVLVEMRRAPRSKHIYFGLCEPGRTSFYIPGKNSADRAELRKTLLAADGGDPGPVNALVVRWFDELPADCAWRVDVLYEVWHRCRGGATVREVWNGLRTACRPSIPRSVVADWMARGVREGLLTVDEDLKWFTSVGDALTYDPLLFRRGHGTTHVELGGGAR